MLEQASALEEGFHTGGWKAGFTKEIGVLKGQRKTGYISPDAIARLYADLGDKEPAFEWLQIAYEERDNDLTLLKNDFVLDRIRSDPRYADLLRRIGLPQCSRDNPILNQAEAEFVKAKYPKGRA